MLVKRVAARSGRHRAAGCCPIFVRRCTIGVNAKLPWCLSLFKIHFSSDAPRNEFAGGERGDNRGTKCPDPKALLDGIQQRFFIWCTNFHRRCRRIALRSARPCSASRHSRVIPSPDFIHSCRSIAAGAQPCACRPGLPGWRAQKASVTLSFRRPCGRENGRQFSYKHNAEEGVRLDEKRGTKDRGGRGGWRRSFGGGRASVCRGFHEPPCGRHVRSDAICRHDGVSGRCVRIRCVVRIRMNGRFSDPASPARGAVSGPAGRPSGDRCARIDHVSRSAAFLRSLHPDDIAAAHRGGRTTLSARAAARACAVSPGLDGGAGVSRENECRRGKAR